ncbi:MAG: DUF885 family protein, partial [Acidobacteriota bacterium]
AKEVGADCIAIDTKVDIAWAAERLQPETCVQGNLDPRLMVEGGFQEEREAALKWTRAQLGFTQLSTYLVGYLEHIDLRRDIEARRGEAFDLRAYHDELLSYGSPPVQFVRALMLGEPIPD